MSLPIEVSESLLFQSIFFRSDLFDFQKFVSDFEEKYGNCLIVKYHPKTLLNYYTNELFIDEEQVNQDLVKRYILVSTTRKKRDVLLQAKLDSLKLEKKFSRVDSKGLSKRIVNIDSGLISLENVILATFKSYAHRVFIGQNIFADLTYITKDKEYTPLDWTYPDYKEEQLIEIFNWMRRFLLLTL